MHLKNVYSVSYGYNVLKISFRSNCSIIVIYDPCCLDFCLEDLSTDVSRVLKVSYYYCIPVGFSLYIC